LVLLAAFTSLRWGELAARRRSDIDIRARTCQYKPGAGKSARPG
jgi:integrase